MEVHDQRRTHNRLEKKNRLKTHLTDGDKEFRFFDVRRAFVKAREESSRRELLRRYLRLGPGKI